MKKTKIICTIGPASGEVTTIKKMIKAGMNAARINFSHGTFETNSKYLKNIRKAEKNLGTPVLLIQDLPGPKIRIGEFKNKSVTLKDGQTFILTEKKIIGNEKKVFVNYDGLSKEVKKGDTIFLEDGTKKLEVIKVNQKNKEIICRVIVGGILGSNKGVNLPKTKLKIGSLTKKDIEALKFGIKNKFDYVALSFVRSAADIKKLRRLISKNKGNASIIAKIEKPEAVKNIDEIIKEADAIMIARGDLGIEMPIEEVPEIQKHIIKKCRDAARPVIVATQMLESMTFAPRPTRAEVTDVANAIFDGTDAIMLSGETANGKYPIKTVQTMSQIAKKAEKDLYHQEHLLVYRPQKMLSPTEFISYDACKTAAETNAKAIIVFTESGRTAQMISRHRPPQPIIALTSDEKISRNLILSWNVLPIKKRIAKKPADLIKLAKKISVQQKLAKKDDQIVIAFGISLKDINAANALVVQNV